MMRDPVDDQIQAPLLRYLQARLKQPNLGYLQTPQRFAGGVENRVYGFSLHDAGEDFSKPLILRLFAPHDEPTRGHRECALQNALANLGFPAARALLSEVDIAVLGGPFTIMHRLPGRIRSATSIGLSNALQSWLEWSFLAPTRVAEVQAKLHRVDAAAVMRSMRGAGADLLTTHSRLEEIRERIERSSLDGLRGGVAWLFEHEPRNNVRLAICHGDLWAGNILTDGTRVSGVIDWSMAALAPPEFDVAITRMGWRYGVPEMPGVLGVVLVPVQFDASERYLRAYRRRHEVNPSLLSYFQAMRCLEVCSWVYERRLGIVGAIRADLGPNIWDVPGSTRGFESYFRRCTGVVLDLPPESYKFFY
jgi:aminoglycoside phosphotransferase (APT) family kinase protein